MKRLIVLLTALGTALAMAAPAGGQEERPDVSVPEDVAEEIADVKAETIYLVQMAGEPAAPSVYCRAPWKSRACGPGLIEGGNIE